MTDSSNDHYAPWRTSVDAMRLSYQHFIWREQLQYNLHPSIQLQGAGPWDIADIATGHCLWALQVADTLGTSKCNIQASDVSLDLCPRAHVLPANISVRQWDFFDTVPEEWLAKFDVVHVRLIVAAFRDGKDPKPVLEKLMSMLKPGGYLQWDEYEYNTALPVVSYDAPPSIPNPSISHNFAEQFYYEVVAGFGWDVQFFHTLGDQFSDMGLTDVVSEKKEQKHSSVAQASHQLFISFCSQMIGVFEKFDPGRAEQLERLLRKHVQAAKVDGVLCSPITKVVVGMKPL